MKIYIRSRFDDDVSEFSEPQHAAYLENPDFVFPREGEQFISAEDRAFRVETVEWLYGERAIHLFCTEYPRQSPPRPREKELQEALEELRRQWRRLLKVFGL